MINFLLISSVSLGTCHISEVHRLAAPQENHDFLVCVLSVLVPPSNLSCYGAKVKKTISSFTIICISALQLFENSFTFSLSFLHAWLNNLILCFFLSCITIPSTVSDVCLRFYATIDIAVFCNRFCEHL